MPWPTRLPAERWSFLAASLFASYELPLATSRTQKNITIILLIIWLFIYLLPLTFSETALAASLTFCIVAYSFITVVVRTERED